MKKLTQYTTALDTVSQSLVSKVSCYSRTQGDTFYEVLYT